MTVESLLERNGYTSLPLRRTEVGHLGIDVLVNGHAARFLVDTGASATVMDRESAARWSLASAGETEVAVGCGITRDATKITLEELRLASLTLSEVTAYVVDLSHVNTELAKKGAGRVDGVIGGDILGERSAVITYASRTLHLKR